MSSTIGILAIGSLYWAKGTREPWRTSRLRVQDEIPVAVPIRYGRLSTQGKGRDTYTMVFSSDAIELGQAKVLPCSNDVTCLEDLKSEARFLWAAERNKHQPDGTIACDWGCVALFCNPNGNASDELLDGWANHVVKENHFLNLARGIEGGRLISERGLLQIPWPGLANGNPVNLDLLLATTNEPSPTYPSAETVACAWKQALKERPTDKPDDYFWNNRKYGITTFQDEEIEEVLKSGTGCLSQLGSIFAH